MRIIGGSFKGTKIFEAFDKNTRPLKDLVKESILNILEYSKDSKINLNNSLVLDLFSGTGSFGLECISRGASKVYFVENYDQSIEILNKNIKKLKCQNKAKVLNENAFNFFKNKELKNLKLDLIFLDPPYRANYHELVLNQIFNCNFIKKGTIVICEHSLDLNIKTNILWEIYDVRTYGQSKLSFLIHI